MPSEYREIEFTKTELARAMHDLAAAQTPELPPRAPTALRIADDPEIELHVRFGEDEEERFTAAQITAALIRHAKKIGVPVARRARKQLAIKNGTVALRLWIE